MGEKQRSGTGGIARQPEHALFLVPYGERKAIGDRRKRARSLVGPLIDGAIAIGRAIDQYDKTVADKRWFGGIFFCGEHPLSESDGGCIEDAFVIWPAMGDSSRELLNLVSARWLSSEVYDAGDSAQVASMRGRV